MIAPIRLSRLAEECSVPFQGQDVLFDRVSLDSRDCDGALFIALRGKRHDAHDFIDSAIANGALAIGTEQEQQSDVPQLVVDNTQELLGYAGKINRSAFKGSLVALTGSSGKTTTKEMLRIILSQTAKCKATAANYNNEIGVPLTLLSIDADTEKAIVEIGARHIGDIRYLGKFVQPDVALLLNAGVAHIGEFGSYENIVKAKGEIYETLGSEGVAILNMDDPASAEWRSLIGARRIISFSIEGLEADLQAKNIEMTSEGSHFDLVYKGDSKAASLPMAGRHNVQNALAAGAVALALGMSLEQLVSGFALCCSTQGRLERKSLANGLGLIDDSYNANPLAVKAAIDVLALQSGPSILVLGEMAELGKQAELFHKDVAQYARDKNIEALYVTGPYSQSMAEIFGEKGLAFASKEELFAKLSSDLAGNETVLVKGSRSAGMDKIVQMLEGELA